MKPTRVRIAPSPTGYPHIGTIFQALINYAYARKHKGQFLVRIEDTDRERFVSDAEDSIFEALKWFNLEPDESPRHKGIFGPYRQSERLDIYKEFADQLVTDDHAYHCFCSRERLDEVRKSMQKDGKPPMYDKKCRDIPKLESLKRAETEDSVIRMKIPADQQITFTDEIRGEITFESEIVDDQVIFKSDGFPTYHLAVVVDDHLMEISHIVRGEEWISSAPKHILLFKYLGWELPSLIHTPILRNPDKSKLSKRHGHASVSWYIENGYLPEAIINFLITRVWNHPNGDEIFGIDEIIKHFDFKDMHIQGPIIDLDKLNWINGQWIRNKADEELISLSKPFLPKSIDLNKLQQIIPLIKERLHNLKEIEELTNYFFNEPTIDPKLILKESKQSSDDSASYIQKVLDILKDQKDWSPESLEKSLRALQSQVDWKPRPAFMTIRIAISGVTHTPPLFEMMEVLGKDTVINRLSHAKKSLLT